MKIIANGLEFEVEDSGAADPDALQRPAVVLIMGLGMQLIAWPPAVVQALIEAGFRVIRFDNRDIGQSSPMDHLGRANLLWSGIKHKLGLVPRPMYTLADMAADTLGVMDALKVDKAHIVGVSMGGMIAQRVAIAAPQRVLSLASIMSTSGARGLPPPHKKVLQMLLRRPSGKDPQQVVDHFVRLFGVIGSPAFPVDPVVLRGNILAGVQRSYRPQGTARQMLAVVSDVTRAQQLTRIACPTLVLHGKADPLVPYACGEDTARRIAGARMVGIDGMGHDLPPGVVDHLLRALLPHLQAASHR